VLNPSVMKRHGTSISPAISNCPEGATFSQRGLRKSVDRYGARSGDFVRVGIHAEIFQTDGLHEFVEIVDDTLVETVELRSVLSVERSVSLDGR